MHETRTQCHFESPKILLVEINMDLKIQEELTWLYHLSVSPSVFEKPCAKK